MINASLKVDACSDIVSACACMQVYEQMRRVLEQLLVVNLANQCFDMKLRGDQMWSAVEGFLGSHYLA